MMVGETLQSSAHYLVWYAKDRQRLKARKLFDRKIAGADLGDHYTQLEDRAAEAVRPMTPEDRATPSLMAPPWRPFQLVSLATGGFRPNTTIDYRFEGRTYHPGANKCWRTTKEGLDRLAAEGRIVRAGDTIRYKQYLDDFPLVEVGSIWTDTGRDPENFYVVQTPKNVIRRCLLMTTDPGDLVLDPTCGSGTTAYVAEQWGRRWITVDVSRVPLALARQRLLTATFPWYALKEEKRGPAGGFVYKRKQNSRGEEVGGIVPHVRLKSIAQNEPPAEEVLVDRPEVASGITRVTGPFTLEATIPRPADWDDETEPGEREEREGAGRSFADRMLEVLRQSPVLRHGGNRTVTLANVRPPARTLVLAAEVEVANGAAPGAAPQRVAFAFGPENGAVTEMLVFEAAREAHAKSYAHLYVIGFAIQPNARKLVDECAQAVGVPATYVQATPDLAMGDLLKNMRSSQIFSVCGLPDVKLRTVTPKNGKAAKGAEKRYEVELLGLDVFDASTMDVLHKGGDDVPAWFLDTDYNGLCFHVCQAFFPKTQAWDSLKKALKATHEESVWEHLAGTTSAPFEAGEHGQVAVKVIDERGNELLVVWRLAEAAEARAAARARAGR